MNESNLNRSGMRARLVLLPEFTFDRLTALLGQSGWNLVSQVAAPIIAGEPEHAVFERGAHGRLVYTFNPACRFRILDTSDSGVLVTALPLADVATVASWLASADERTLLLGILAAAQLGDPSLAPQVDALRSHSRRALAQAAQRTSTVLQPAVPSDTAQVASLLGIEVLKTHLVPLLQALARDPDGRVAATLQPHESDFTSAFTPAAAPAAISAYASAPQARVASADGSELEIALAPAGMLADDNELSRQFPSGYRSIAHLLAPQRVWARWKYVRPGEKSGMAYDGLVWLDERWVWFSKPYRALSA